MKPTLQQEVNARLAEIADTFEAMQQGGRTGRAKKDEFGDVIGRFGGYKSGYRELADSPDTPKAIAAAIRKGSGPAYSRVVLAVKREIQKWHDQERFHQSVPIAPHAGSRRCVRCVSTHTRSQHRFHGKGSFAKTHDTFNFKDNPMGKNSVPPVKIYGRVLRVEAQKTQKHRCDDECKDFNHCYAHDFGRGAVMYGLPDRSVVRLPNGQIFRLPDGAIVLLGEKK